MTGRGSAAGSAVSNRVLGVTPPGAIGQATFSTERLVRDVVRRGDAADLLPLLERGSVDLFFTSPPYADQRAYSRIHPDRYVEWFLPFAGAMFDASAETGSLVLNTKNRVANRGPLSSVVVGGLVQFAVYGFHGGGPRDSQRRGCDRQERTERRRERCPCDVEAYDRGPDQGCQRIANGLVGEERRHELGRVTINGLRYLRCGGLEHVPDVFPVLARDS